MKDAIEFVKKFGTGEAKRLLKDAHGCSSVGLYDGKYNFNTDDLKSLVESYELVKEHGSIERANQYADSEYTAPEVKERLKQAISDVELC